MPAVARAQVAPPPPATSDFTVYIQSRPIGTEQVTVRRSATGFDVSSIGRMAAPVDVVLRQLTVRYDAGWRPLELSIDASIGGRASTMHAVVDNQTIATDIVT